MCVRQVARKLVLMEQDLERAEERAEHNERCVFTNRFKQSAIRDWEFVSKSIHFFILKLIVLLHKNKFLGI